MKQTINSNDFQRAFESAGRKKQFSPAGLRALFDYLVELEDMLSEEFELDVIALCCEYTEYKSLAEFNSDYSDEYATLDEVSEVTQVIEIDDEAFIIQQF